MTGSIACGGKHPVMCKLVDELHRAWNIVGISELTLVSAWRDPEQVHRSWTRPLSSRGDHWWPRWDRAYVVEDLIQSRDASLWNREHVQIDFEALRASPEASIGEFARRCRLPEDMVPKAVAMLRNATA